MKIAIEIDGPILQFIPGFLDWYNTNNNTKFVTKDISKNSIAESLKISQERYEKEMEEFYKSRTFLNLLAVPDAKKYIEKLFLVSEGEKDLILTASRPEKFRGNTINSVKQRVIDENTVLSVKEVFFNPDRYFLRDPENERKKSEVCLEQKVDVLVEDSLETAKDCASHSIRTILFDLNGEYAWNHSETLPINVVRAASWPQLYGYIEILDFAMKHKEIEGVYHGLRFPNNKYKEDQAIYMLITAEDFNSKIQELGRKRNKPNEIRSLNLRIFGETGLDMGILPLTWDIDPEKKAGKFDIKKYEYLKLKKIF